MIVLASAGGEAGIAAAVEILKQGGTALDAVEAATRLVEADLNNHTVGIGGWPNLLGQVELDASIMDGTTLNSGAVGALQGYYHPISVARRVLHDLPHVFLIGEGAARYAEEVGAERAENLTPEARRGWEAWLQENVPADIRANWPPEKLAHWAWLTADPTLPKGTVNLLARDHDGHLASAVSTSGWAWKYPGRLGDSPCIGAGNYCDDRYGAAACTGFGELTIRCGTARSIVLYQKMGLDLRAACREAAGEIASLRDRPGDGWVNIVALNAAGEPYALTTGPQPHPYCVWQDGMAEPEMRKSELFRAKG